MPRQILRQVLECGNEACAVAAFGLKPGSPELSRAAEYTNAKSGESLCSSPQSKTLPRSLEFRQILQQGGFFVNGYLLLVLSFPRGDSHHVKVFAGTKLRCNLPGEDSWR